MSVMVSQNLDRTDIKEQKRQREGIGNALAQVGVRGAQLAALSLTRGLASSTTGPVRVVQSRSRSYRKERSQPQAQQRTCSGRFQGYGSGDVMPRYFQHTGVNKDEKVVS